MILLIGIVLGLIAGFIRAKILKQPMHPIHLQGWWLVFLAFVPQLLAFNPPIKSIQIPDQWVAVLLVSSQTILLVFAWLNRKVPGGWLLGLGLLLNYLVIVMNGGLMPISPETVQSLIPDAPQGTWQIGERLGKTKDIVLPTSAMWLAFLSDRFTLPAWINYKVAFSLGDVFIALGAFWLFWSIPDGKDGQKDSPRRLSDVRTS